MSQNVKKKSRIRIKKSRMWIVGVGVVIAYGFLHNCAIAPFNHKPIVDWDNLILAFSVVIGLGCARDIVLRKFLYIKEAITEQNKKNSSILTNKVWIPFIGWCLVAGFAVNIMVVPYFPQVDPVNWSYLQSALAIFLGVSGVREYGIYSEDKKRNPNNMGADFPSSDEPV